MKIKILIPVYNDWESLLRLLQEIDENIGVIKKIIVGIKHKEINIRFNE